MRPMPSKVCNSFIFWRVVEPSRRQSSISCPSRREPRCTRPMAIRPTYFEKSSEVISICSSPGFSSGPGMYSIMASSSGSMLSVGLRKSSLIQPCLAEPYSVGKSSCSSVASRLNIRSNTISCTSSGRQLGLSTLFITTTGLRPISIAFCSTKRVCGIGPSNASTNSRQPSAMLSTRSTSPPKSACPGVSIMFILYPLYSIDTFLERIVMPRSRSRSLLSSISSPAFWFSRKRWPARSILSTSVVLPWSTCAMIAMLRIFCIFLRCYKVQSY